MHGATYGLAVVVQRLAIGGLRGHIWDMSEAGCSQLLVQVLVERKLTLPQPAGPMTSWAYLPISLISQ